MQAGGRGNGVHPAVLVSLALVAVAVLVGVRLWSDGAPQADRGSAAAPSPADDVADGPVVEPLRPDPERVPPQLLDGIRLVDVTEEVGLQSGATGGRSAGRAPVASEAMDAGVAVADVDDDNDDDLLLTSAGPASGLHRNDGGRFTRLTGRAGIPGVARATTAVFGDVDGDRDLDVFVGGPGAAFGRLLLATGDGRYVDRSVERGVVGRPAAQAQGRAVRGADFGDVDGDGDLDLVVTDWNQSAVATAAVAGSGPEEFATQCEYATYMRRQLDRGLAPPTGDTRLFLNDGEGSFRDGTASWGLTGLGATLAFTPQLHDLDGDGFLDLVVAGDVCTSRVFRNDGGRRFVDHTPTSGAGTAENAMGSLVHDLDGDGRPDWLVTAIGYPTEDDTCPRVSLFAGCSGNRVFLNDGTMEFTEATDALGLRNSWWGWGIAAVDLANDGEAELVVTNGRPREPGAVDPGDQRQVYYDAFDDDPTQVWVRRPGGDFVDAAGQVGLVHRDVGLGLVPLDHDRDGRTDLLVTQPGEAPVLYRNVTRPRRHWLAVRLRDPSSVGDARALGARLEVTSAGRTTTRWMHTSGSYQSQAPAEVHVGLGGRMGRDAGPVRVRVWWPGTDEPQVVDVATADRLVTITRER
jgi:hypothetical protein